MKLVIKDSKTKLFVLFLSLLLSTTGFSQATASNSYLTVNFIGWAADNPTSTMGKYSLEVISNQTCSLGGYDIAFVITGIPNLSPGNNNWSLSGAHINGNSQTFTFSGPYVGTGKFAVQILTVCHFTSIPLPIMVSTTSSLPMVLAYFKGTRDNDHLTFTWQTTQEQNVDHFAVLKKIDGDTTWSTAAVLPTLAQGGNSSIAIDYSLDYTFPVKTVAFLSPLLMFLGFNRQRRGSMLIVALSLSLLIISCSKKSIQPSNISRDPATYMLVEYDQDGRAHYSPNQLHL